jgi:hypothetical protein
MLLCILLYSYFTYPRISLLSRGTITYIQFIIIIIIIIIFLGSAAQRELGPPRPRCFLITHNNAPQSVGLLWSSDQLVVETSI